MQFPAVSRRRLRVQVDDDEGMMMDRKKLWIIICAMCCVLCAMCYVIILSYYRVIIDSLHLQSSGANIGNDDE